MNKLKSILSKVQILCLPFLCGILGAMGGTDNSSKLYRRLGVPLLITLFAYLKIQNIWVLTIMIMFFVLSIGYGIPSSWNNDNGSIIGRFFYNLTNQNEFWSNVLCRGTLVLLIGITLLSIPLIKKNWVVYLLCCLGISMIYCFLSWKDLGQFIMFNRKLNWSEFITYSSIGLFSMLIILIGGKK